MWLRRDPLVLASRSEVRRAVLEAAAIPVEVIPADIDEREIEEEAGLKGPANVAMLLAHSKASAVAALMPGVTVLGADQTLALGDQRFSKPADMAAARTQLLALRGKTHELHSAVAVVRDSTPLSRTVILGTLLVTTVDSLAKSRRDKAMAGEATAAEAPAVAGDSSGEHVHT